MVNQISFYVPGEARPQARPRLYKGRVWSPKSDWRKKVECYAYEQLLLLGNFTFIGPIGVDILYYFKRPSIHFRTGRFTHLMKEIAPKYCTNRYDLDNLNKAVLDAITDADLIDDDRYIVQMTSRKIWENELFKQGVSIIIKGIE